jgi:hypothetical protein
MGHFTPETLEKFQELCAAGIDFGEGPTYDFAMCLKSDGDIYGVSPGETCEDGKPISDAEAARIQSKKKVPSSARMAKLKAAFLKKTGRKMSKEELAKAAWMVDNTKAPK